MADKYESLVDAPAFTHFKVSRPPVFKSVPFSELTFDLKRNPRDEDGNIYHPTNRRMRDLMQSIKLKGFLPSFEIVVHEDEDGILDVLRGNLRAHALHHLGFSMIPCCVFRGLTPEQKLIVVYDHGQENDIGEIGRLKNVRELMQLGMSRRAMAEVLQWTTKSGAVNINKVQGYCELLALPQEIQEEWKNQQRNKDGKHTMPKLAFTTDIRNLFEKQKEDIANGTPRGHIGPVLAKEIATLRETGETSKETQKKGALTATALQGMGDSVSNVLFKTFLFGIAGLPDQKYGPITAKIDDAMNLVHPNPKPATIPEIFSSEEPVSEEPVSEEPVSEEPVSEEPVSEEPVSLVTVSEGIKNKKRRSK